MSPLFEYSPFALSLVAGGGRDHRPGNGGLWPIVQQDIKRIVAWSTLSPARLHDGRYRRLGLFGGHLPPVHPCLFQGAAFPGRGRGHCGPCTTSRTSGAWGAFTRRMPITYATALIGVLALAGIPGTAGFFSKDALISAVTQSSGPVSAYAGVVPAGRPEWPVTAFLTVPASCWWCFHGREPDGASHVHGNGAARLMDAGSACVPGGSPRW